MNKTIRKSVFETNSSSTHSITLGRKDCPKGIAKLADEDNIVQIYPGEFGWGPEQFNDAATKASYALTWVKEMNSEKHRSMLEEVIKRVTKCFVEFIPSPSEIYPWGYIDQQSFPDVGAEVFASEDVLENFIFNPDSILTIDNDNHD